MAFSKLRASFSCFLVGYIIAAFMFHVYHSYQRHRSLPFFSKDQVEQIENFLLGSDDDRGRNFNHFAASRGNPRKRRKQSSYSAYEGYEGYDGTNSRRKRQESQVEGYGRGEPEKDSVDFGGSGRRPGNRNYAGDKKEGDSHEKLVVGFSMFGGVGNQIYFMLEAIYLVRKLSSAILVMPSMLLRTDIAGYNPTKRIIPFSSVWDKSYLSHKLVNTVVSDSIPKFCEGKIDVLYMFYRPWQKLPSTDNFTVPNETREKACALTQYFAGRWGNWGATKHVCHSMFENTQIRFRKQYTGAIAREMHKLPRPSCVWVTGHSYDKHGDTGMEYLFKFIHYLNLNPRFHTQLAAKFPDIEDFGNLAVIHIRHDEKLCHSVQQPAKQESSTGSSGNDDNCTEVCVRRRHGNGPGAVFWTPLEKYAVLIDRALAELDAQITSVYVAISPYMPASEQKVIRGELGKFRKVIPPPSVPLDPGEAEEGQEDAMELNFLERQLAIEAEVFIGDFASTWSSTVHYKRRTYGKSSLWANKVLGKPCRDDCRGTKYHEDNERIREPGLVRKSFKARLFGR